jgi:hypothetical protein
MDGLHPDVYGHVREVHFVGQKLQNELFQYNCIFIEIFNLF